MFIISMTQPTLYQQCVNLQTSISLTISYQLQMQFLGGGHLTWDYGERSLGCLKKYKVVTIDVTLENIATWATLI